MTSVADEILEAAITKLGGTSRAGQRQMADAVFATLSGGPHLLVQAGTGTGKSLAYLAPALAHLVADPDQRVVIATATLALQAQLAQSDIPVAVAAAKEVTGRDISWTVLKGRSNYACLSRVRLGLGLDQASLFGGDDEAMPTEVGAEVVELRDWAEECAEQGRIADRDDAPAHGPMSWGQVSMSGAECPGSQCPFAGECFAEQSKEAARNSQLVVTNHALLAINAVQNGVALPHVDALIVDEAHELAARVTSATSGELSPQMLDRLVRRCRSHVDDEQLADLIEAAEELSLAFDESDLGPFDSQTATGQALAVARDALRPVVSQLSGVSEPDIQELAGAASELFTVADRLAAADSLDVVWLSERERFGRIAHVAPLSVADLIREGILADQPGVLTSATLTLGGGFQSLAYSLGLRAPDESPLWTGLDVGSPFDYPRQGILYVAAGLPANRVAGVPDEVLAEVAELVWAAGGRTLGLFSSQRAAVAATEYCRKELPHLPIMCQGEAHLADLRNRFATEPETSLFGTLSLWQGIDIPGDACELVIIDKIPFPRPDDPLMQARQRAVSEAGGNGFMRVAATHAALLLAQGTGRLIRRHSDRGVVAILDPRLVTARYGSFLLRSIPPFWQTTDREAAIGALRRLQEARKTMDSTDK